RIKDHVGVVKVGLSLFVGHGPAAVERFTSQGAKVFLDLKLHDIPNTVELAATKAGALGVSFLTVHAQGGESMLKAAVAGSRTGASTKGLPAPTILAVTVLTSLSAADVIATGHSEDPAALAGRLAALAKSAGVGGLVCSAQEAARLKPHGLFLCTPGIRPAGADVGDQTRVETPTEAIRAGANLLVVGRPIYAAKDPVAAAKAVHDEVATALRG
ncbi:MAG: orotidine-5'-phosphate decarboxylase, partial [Myxococcaceae bacterium]